MISKTITRGQTWANLAQEYYGSSDAVQKILDDNGIALSDDCNDGYEILIDESYVVDSVMRFDISRANFDTANENEFSDFRKIINKTGIHPAISFDGIGTYVLNGNAIIVNQFNNVGRFNTNGSLETLDLRAFALHFMQIQDAPAGWQPINLGEYPEIEIIKIINCPNLEISISDNYARKLRVLLENCQYVDFSNINNIYDDIEIEITNFIIARRNDQFCEIMANKNIICGGGRLLTLNGNTTDYGKTQLDRLVAQGWTVVATGYGD